ncbi:MAG: RNA polymerase II elongation factor [Trizodia sp. TS-e1964]|nr:MAG: RNA polymerase II elongation factor [Trizodia sp. TS-e1964]
MNAKEIVGHIKALQKATAKGEPAGNILAILESMKKEIVATEELLRSTKVGIFVNKQKNHSDPRVKALSAEIIAKWKVDVGKKKASPKSVIMAKQKSSDSNTPPPGASYTIAPEHRTWKKDGVNLAGRTGAEIRDNIVGLMYDGLCFYSTEAPAVILKRAIDIERATLTLMGPETTSAYKTKLRSLYQNLKNRQSLELRQNVVSGVISATQLVTMTHAELRSSERREADEKLIKENMDKAMVAQAERSISTSLTCGKCGKKEVSYTQAQTRSADEPMTTFCECVNCGNRWKVYKPLMPNWPLP